MSTESTKKRRRLRLSCIECTSRRQRCDRQTPCALCVKRGIPDLCVYSAEPFIRPEPKRSKPLNESPGSSVARKSASPSTGDDTDDSQKKIHELNMKIASLEQTIVNLTLSGNNGNVEEEAPEGSNHGVNSPQPLEHDLLPDGSRPFDFEMFSGVALAWRKNLVNPNEFVGASKDTGMFLGKPPRADDAIQLPSTVEQDPETEDQHFSLDQIDASLPSIEVLQLLIHRFLQEEAWRFGIESKWLLDIQQNIMSVPGVPGSRFHPRHCTKLAVLFGIIAITLEGYTQTPQLPLAGDASFFINCALSCRRLGVSNRQTESVEQGCVAVLLLVHYLINHCRYMESWLILGHAMRDAISIGLHEAVFGGIHTVGYNVSSEQLALKRRIWYNLVMPERFYSATLGRPPMVNDELYKKGLAINDRFSRFTGYDEFLQLEVKLWDIMTDASGKAFNDGVLDSRLVFAMDRRIDAFSKEFTTRYAAEKLSDFDSQDLAPRERRFAVRYWSTLQRRSYLCRTKMHMISMLHSKPLKSAEEARLSFNRTQNRDICLHLVKELLISQRDLIHASNLFNGSTDCEPVGDWIGNNWVFEGSITTFESCVVAIGLMSQLPIEERSLEHEQLVDATIHCLQVLSLQCTAKTLPEMSYQLLLGLSQHQDWRRSTVDTDTSPPNIPSLTPEASGQQEQTIWDFMDSSSLQPDATMAMLTAPIFNNLFYPQEQPVESIHDLFTNRQLQPPFDPTMMDPLFDPFS
ncbi:hypothetical protein DL96DRAFT_1128774 [Flagelloscypha sp. PMI_526]|nr:hypothetical protein DL96DRAFT_1128774 [Flagelloscypha sp. PMI_526]